jgi:hypothetical protein
MANYAPMAVGDAAGRGEVASEGSAPRGAPKAAEAKAPASDLTEELVVETGDAQVARTVIILLFMSVD